MKAVIIDYGAGNLHSLAKALDRAGAVVAIDTDPRVALRADVMVLPGVGAFGQAAGHLAEHRDTLRDALRNGMPCLGICLGMQVLFDRSEESEGAGIGIIAGSVTRLRAHRVPQIGWSSIENAREPLIEASALRTAYFANSFVCRPDDAGVVTAWSRSEDDVFASVVRYRNVVGVQFHPEKSSAPGVDFIRRFIDSIGDSK